MASSSSRKRRYSSSNDGQTGMDELLRGIPLIDLTESDDEEPFPEDFDDLSDDDDEDAGEPNAGALPRGQATGTGRTITAAPLPGYRFVASITTDMGTEVTIDANVELMEGDVASGDFLRVKRIMQHRQSGNVMLRGILFRRAFLMDRMLKKAQNEICAILVDVDPGVADPALDEHLADVPVECVGLLREILLTNIPFAGYYGSKKWSDRSFRDRYAMSAKTANDEGVLCCRWKRVQYVELAGKIGHSGALLTLRQPETDVGVGIPDAALVYWWRFREAQGKGPSAFPDGTVLDLTSDRASIATPLKSRKKARQDSPAAHVTKTVEKTTVQNEETISTDAHGNRTVSRMVRSESVYETQSTPKRDTRRRLDDRGISDADLRALMSEPRTHFDFLAGGGGATTGAESKGSVITLLLDKSIDACNTLRVAFPGARILNMVLGDFFHNDDGRSYQVVTAHISFPCKTYSGSHTTPGQEDEMNEDAACSVEDISRKTRPKVATFEQTNAMVVYHRKNFHVWRRMIRDITSASYSVRWRVMDATEHHSPSKRDRLIILAACPGHPLPPFPPSRAGPKRTVNEVLAQVALMRVEEHMKVHSKFKQAKTPLPDYDIPLPYTITCDGGDGDIHPCGWRSFIMQELAMLAGFPWWRKFAVACMTRLRVIIGNAVPAGLAADIYEMVHRSIDLGEEEMAQWLLDAGLVGEEDVIAIREKQKEAQGRGGGRGSSQGGSAPPTASCRGETQAKATASAY
ncbi:hypothetical protein LTR56_019349 [Elasticomyces elasticus]|nr:hypothetical protein LTR56_019349 [Elasticomyces elasticus]KAK3639769.1 hypothetical protein LTR22_017277 [Elasticomyces elasticus]KAK4913504.1 hypothetical protein LTR49_018209 [Elasticomyces elasticus]KAK5750944.1 hypothetical protein LTS12_019017 [Elasticomyces elasticus]